MTTQSFNTTHKKVLHCFVSWLDSFQLYSICIWFFHLPQSLIGLTSAVQSFHVFGEDRKTWGKNKWYIYQEKTTESRYAIVDHQCKHRRKTEKRKKYRKVKSFLTYGHCESFNFFKLLTRNIKNRTKISLSVHCQTGDDKKIV